MSPGSNRENISEIERIIDQLERGFEGHAWHGSSMSEILGDINCEVAADRPLPDTHSIWEIVLHTTVWLRTVRERLQGKPIAELPDHEDWPHVTDTSCDAWEEALRDLRSEYELFREEALRWRDRNLGETCEGQRYTVYEMLHGVIQHNLYHAGQIAVLKKGTTGAEK